MFKRLKRIQELEKEISVQDMILRIIRRSFDGNPFEYTIITNHRHKQQTRETYVITAKLKE